MAFNSRQYEWADITLILGGNDITGIRAIKYTEKIEREAIYGKGRYPLSVQSGNASYEGEIEVLQSEYEALVASGNGSIMGLALDALVGYGNPANGDIPIFDRVVGLRFTEAGKEFKQGDKLTTIKLPFVCLRIKNQV